MKKKFFVTVAFFNAAGRYDQVDIEIDGGFEDRALSTALDQVRREQAGAKIYRPGCFVVTEQEAQSYHSN
ncbi:hypothetical protein [Marinobacter fonticola]|uniref:hypothetical protein n=1 Tax=Marinobacter fonticola TaxID=2603215 RepID=UPI0011E70C2E|nr:hypothetical protein [Marinobacter fonticola]